MVRIYKYFVVHAVRRSERGTLRLFFYLHHPLRRLQLPQNSIGHIVVDFKKQVDRAQDLTVPA